MSALSRSRAVAVRKEDTERMEEEMRKMEAKLEMLRRAMGNAGEQPKASVAGGGTWTVNSKPRSKLTRSNTTTATRAPAATGSGTLSAAVARPAAAATPPPAATAPLSVAAAAIAAASAPLPVAPAALAVAPTPAALLQKRVTFGAREVEAPAPAPAPRPPAKEEAPAPRPAAKAAAAEAGSSAGTLGGGCFDEAESAASFQEALRAWREGRECGPTASAAGPDSRSAGAAAAAAVQEVPAGPRKPGSFWSSIGGPEVDLARCGTPVGAEAAVATDSQTQRDAAAGEDKVCCFNCYKQLYRRFAVERCSPLGDTGAPTSPSSVGTRRLLCSEACADRWVEAMREKAEAQRKRQEKMEALLEAQRALELQQQPQLQQQQS